MNQIKDFQGEDYTLVQNDGDILELNSEFNTEYDGFIIKIGEGEYQEVYGFTGSIPFLDKTVVKVK